MLANPVGLTLVPNTPVTFPVRQLFPTQLFPTQLFPTQFPTLNPQIAPIADAARIARQARARIKENFAASAMYNVIAVPLALVGLATPLAAAAAMSISSITVSLNALRLK